MEHTSPHSSFRRLERSRGRVSRNPKKCSLSIGERAAQGGLATSAKIREIFIDRSCTHLVALSLGPPPLGRAPPRTLRRAILVVAT